MSDEKGRGAGGVAPPAAKTQGGAPGGLKSDFLKGSATPIGTEPLPEGLNRRTAVRLSWQRGRLRWKLNRTQREVYDFIRGSPKKRFYLNCGRRYGKTYVIGVLGVETCLQKKGAVVKIMAPTAKLVRQSLKPNLMKILEDCPKNLRPKWNSMDSEFRFPNGSVLAIHGADDDSGDNARGAAADFFAFDECGYIRNLKYIARSVAAPMLLTTNGPMVYASTPPPSAGHDAWSIYRDLKAQGLAVTKTIWDNDLLTEAQREGFIEEERGLLSRDEFIKTVWFRREYLAEFITDTDKQVIPEWDDRMEALLVREVARPEHFDAYTCGDWGFRRDATGMVFGYWHFTEAKLVIEDELLLMRARTEQLADAVQAKEAELWKPDLAAFRSQWAGGNTQPYLRVGDGGGMGAQVNEDMSLLHGLTFVPTGKDKKELMVNELRMWVQRGDIVIHPRCRLLIRQLHTTLWNERRTEFERDEMGHGDLLDALIYLVRNVRRDRNPYPLGYGVAAPGPNTLVPESVQRRARNAGVVLNLFAARKRVLG